MTRARHVPIIEFEYRRTVKAGSPAAADWREMMAWASGASPTGEYEWPRWLDMAAGALVVWVNAWQASIDAGRSPDAATLARLLAHRDGLRALRSQLYLLAMANAREQLRVVVSGPPVHAMGACSSDFKAFTPPAAQNTPQQANLL